MKPQHSKKKNTGSHEGSQSLLQSGSAQKKRPVDPDFDSDKIKKSAKKSKASTKTKGSEKETGQIEAKTAEEVLATIPDAELPDVSDLKGKPYQFFQQRKTEAPQASGELIDIPEAKENCLSGLTIIFTGVLPNLDRTMAENLAKQYGAKVTKSILGKTSLVVIGDDAGPSKIEKIKKNKIKAIDEAGFLELLKRMPAEGGEGETALKAKQKREEEERQIIEEAKAEEKKDKEIESLQHKQEALYEAKPKVIPDSEKLWTVKYAPKDINQLCGNKGQINKLKNWLSNWFENSKHDFKNPGKDGTGIYRACLISGPPGIGKTSAAHLVANSLGFDVLEKNASDVRSKSLLNSEIKSMLNNTSIMGYFKHQHDTKDDVEHKNGNRFCIIMDEVDGMSSGDMGGTGALSAFCRITRMPMILICNDKTLPKMRTFDRVTYDLPFRRPTETEVKARLMTIAHREKIKLDPTIIGQLVQVTNNDIRQMINILSTVSKTRKSLGHKDTADIAAGWKKQTNLKAFDITARLLNGQLYNPNSHHTLNDKIDLYFNDIDFTPLMIQENYIFTKPANATSSFSHLEKVALAADDISLSDRVNSLIRSSEQQWSLLPFHGVMSSVKPSFETAGTFSQRINFTSWLGQNSKTMKFNRILLDLHYHTVLRTLTNKDQFRLYYIPLFIKKLALPLVHEGEAGIESVIETMDHYFMTKEDWDSVLDYGVGSNKLDTYSKKIPTKVKTAFTRKYNSTSHPIAIYRSGNSLGSNTVRKQNVDFDEVAVDDIDDGGDEVKEENNDTIDTKKDKLIKEVKPKKTASRKTSKKQKTSKK